MLYVEVGFVMLCWSLFDRIIFRQRNECVLLGGVFNVLEKIHSDIWSIIAANQQNWHEYVFHITLLCIKKRDIRNFLQFKL